MDDNDNCVTRDGKAESPRQYLVTLAQNRQSIDKRRSFERRTRTAFISTEL